MRIGPGDTLPDHKLPDHDWAPFHGSDRRTPPTPGAA